MPLIIHRRVGQPSLIDLQNWFTFRVADVTIDTGISDVVDRQAHKDLTQASGGLQPAHVASGINGLPIARFDGVDQLLRTPSVWTTLTEPYTVVFVAQKKGGLSDGFLSGHNSGMLVGYTGGTEKWYIFQGSSKLGPTTTDTAAAHTFVATFKAGTNDSLTVDGVGEISGVDCGSSGMDGLTLGFDGFTGYGQVDIGEVLIYTGELTGAPLAKTLAYLGNKWGTH